jgi:hypothetical protein
MIEVNLSPWRWNMLHRTVSIEWWAAPRIQQLIIALHVSVCVVMQLPRQPPAAAVSGMRMASRACCSFIECVAVAARLF